MREDFEGSMKKDDMVQLTIEDISAEGFGIGRAEDMVLFVKDTIPGDEIEAKVMKLKKTYGLSLIHI